MFSVCNVGMHLATLDRIVKPSAGLRCFQLTCRSGITLRTGNNKFNKVSHAAVDVAIVNIITDS
jgi:hypothetical protein